MASTPSSFDAGASCSSWNRFWFQPTDPTTLGFMRIITGLIVIYVHLAYSFDFQAFFGAKGYWDKQAADKERKQYPIPLYNWNSEAQTPTISIPLLLVQRIAAIDFLKRLPEDKTERDADLQFLYFILEPNVQGKMLTEVAFQQAGVMLKNLAQTWDHDRDEMVKDLGKDVYDPTTHKFTLPDFFVQMSPSERVRCWNDAVRFLKLLPKPESESKIDPFDYVVFGWLPMLSENERINLAKFLHELPAGAEGRQRIDYIDTWQADPRQVYHQGRDVFSLWFHVSNPTTMWTFHFLFLGIFVLFTIGLWTRVTSVLTWLAVLFYIHRTTHVLFGMDTMMNILLFYLMIGPSGAALSIDRLIARYRAARAIFRASGRPVPWAEAELAGPQPSVLANFTVRLIQIHFCFMYAASGLAKLKGTTWWNGNAAWMTIANPEFCPVQFPLYEQMLHQLASFLPLLAVVMTGMVYFTLFLEISFPFLIWTRLRPLLICLAAFLHSGIAWVMGLTCFGLLMMTLLLSYVPAATIRERVTWAPGTGQKMTLRYSSRNRRHARVVGLLRALDLTGQISVQEAGAKNGDQDAPAQLIGADGVARTGYDMLKYGLQNLVFGRSIAWMLWVPGVAVLLRWFTGEHSQIFDQLEPAPAADSAKAPAAR